MSRKSITIRGKKYIKYGRGWIDPEDHGGLTGKPTVYRLKRKRKGSRKKTRKRKSDIGNCNYHLCGKRTKLFRCKYCGKYFCKEHLRAKPPGPAHFKADEKEDVIKIEEWKQLGGHPCPDYLEQWKWEREKEKKSYVNALDELIRSDGRETLELIPPKIHGISKRRVIERIKYWLNYKKYPHSKLRVNDFIKNVVFLTITIIISIIVYRNIDTINTIKIPMINLGSLFLIGLCIFILKFVYKISLNLKYAIRGLKNGYKIILLIILLFFILSLYLHQDIYIKNSIEIVSNLNYSKFNPLSINFNISDFGGETNGHEGTQDNFFNLGCSVIQIQYNYKSSEEDSKSAIEYLNGMRKRNGKGEISFDKRVYELAIARAKDMREYNYQDHTNPYTGTCPDNMKHDYGLKSNEYVAENVFGSEEYSEGVCTEIEIRPMTDAINSWMESRGHRYNLLYSNHKAGAVGCYKNMCVFLGLNNDAFGKGCHTAAEGEEFWEDASKQPGEVS